MMTFSDLTDICLQRAGNLGLGQDAAEIELYLYQALLELVEGDDIPAYMEPDTKIGDTQAGERTLALPDNFGRLILPRAMNKRGIVLVDGAQDVDLTYTDPNVLMRHAAGIPDMPKAFTVIQRKLWFYPTPSASWCIRGLYIRKIDRPEPDDPVDLPYPMALITSALMCMTADKNKQPQYLAQQQQMSLKNLAAGSR